MQCARSARSTKLISKLGSSLHLLARQPAVAQWGCHPSFYVRVCGGWGRGTSAPVHGGARARFFWQAGPAS